jgi:predicted metal-dependent phosphoesterase TrpH
MPVLRRFLLESYSTPLEICTRLRQRGMNLVTLTDHDSIGGAAELRRYPDFFVSEEVTCRMPSGTQVHIGVYDLTDRQHVEIGRRRDDLIRLLAYLSEQRMFYAVNHVFSSLTGRREAEDFFWFAEHFPAMEALNGQMLPEANRHASETARRLHKVPLGGSDAHTLASAGTAYTVVPGARNKQEFLAGLRAGYGRVAGKSGGCWKLSRDILLLCAQMMRETKWTLLLAPLVVLVPAGVLVNAIREFVFARHWGTLMNPAAFAPKDVLSERRKQAA